MVRRNHHSGIKTTTKLLFWSWGPFHRTCHQWKLVIHWLLPWQQCFIANQNQECHFTCQWMTNCHWWQVLWNGPESGGKSVQLYRFNCEMYSILPFETYNFYSNANHHSKRDQPIRFHPLRQWTWEKSMSLPPPPPPHLANRLSPY